MSQIDTLDGFYLALKENPGDPVTLLALADWYEEHGQPDNAACLRWTVRHKRFPFEYRREGAGMANKSDAWTDGWFWWAIDDPVGRGWGHPATCHLPRVPWKRLANHFPYDVGVFKHFPSLRKAYEAFFAVWPLFAPAEPVTNAAKVNVGAFVKSAPGETHPHFGRAAPASQTALDNTPPRQRMLLQR